MAFKINVDTVRVKFEDTKEFRQNLRDLKIRYYNQLVDLIPSTYTDESASANYSVHLLALAEEIARFALGLETVLADMSFEELRSFLLYQNLGSILELGPDENLSHEEYRKLLLGMLSVILGGARPANIKRGVELFTDFDVKVTEVFKILDTVELEARRSALNIFDSVLTYPSELGGGNLVLNSEPLFGENFLGSSKRKTLFVDVLVLDAINPKFVDAGGKVSKMLTAVKPGHVELLLRNVFYDQVTISNVVTEVYTKVELGIDASTTGSLLGDPTDLLNQPLGPGTNVFTLGGVSALGFVPLTTIYV